jgi:hypothetical protein
LFASALTVVFAVNAFAEEKADAAPAAPASIVSVQPGAGCPCVNPCNPCQPYFPPVTYRVGLFGHLRPVVYAPVHRPYYYPYYAPPRHYGVYYPAYVW